MKVMKQVKNVMFTLALAFVMTLAFSATAKAELVTPEKVTGVSQKASDTGSINVIWTALLTNDVLY